MFSYFSFSADSFSLLRKIRKSSPSLFGTQLIFSGSFPAFTEASADRNELTGTPFSFSLLKTKNG
jgi:hypothetical protein